MSDQEDLVVKKENKSIESIDENDEDPDDVDFKDSGKIGSLKALGPFIASKENSRNTVYLSDVPDICKDKPCMLGVDEAGRGPVLGPMVYGISYCPLERNKALEDLGCADSKQLTEGKRDIIFNDINTKEYATSCVGWAVEIISPNTISTSMYRRSKCSLNEVSMDSAMGLIQQAIDAGVNIAEVYVDTVGPPEKYQEKLLKRFPNFKITVAKKADSTYPIVSAASICAKVTRDHALKVWSFPEGLVIKDNEFGSGYPGDPVTRRFLTEYIDLVFGFPRLVRFSWSTAENALADKAYDMEFDEPDSEKPKYAGTKLTKFFKGTTKSGEVIREECRFFKQRHLENVMEF
ncbi:ribonuclease H2 subunit A [Drosophila sechellia]|uniref:Ribonuclease n=1 Tax=Drosophila sechellia TaxID=7238 RepID=B4ICW7_DROSE|nr:ribonuclease H2 subunit A [Drosophila sechellia]EDW45393.1 GM16670 [Drosophila sechellia]